MLPTNTTESQIVDPKLSTPVKLRYIELSPKGKRQQQQDQQEFKPHNSRNCILVQASQKENRAFNFEVVNIPIRTQKQFQQIKKYRTEDVIVRNRSTLESESKSKRKKITITKLMTDNQSGSKQPSAFQEDVANQDL